MEWDPMAYVRVMLGERRLALRGWSGETPFQQLRVLAGRSGARPALLLCKRWRHGDLHFGPAEEGESAAGVLPGAVPKSSWRAPRADVGGQHLHVKTWPMYAKTGAKSDAFVGEDTDEEFDGPLRAHEIRAVSGARSLCCCC